ncbi:Glycosyl transferase family 2 [Loktanella fryxellensis]|uniref:Glycosyl transferase family 2 n=1 Tax=Loktanella fryxellensis TaxID=245187 RepID=A0A1H8H5F1_9RHOB|nr:glycosyltransferase family 2 protein [Loktanella fryxellensis]SEN50947.1 Glycosyl transferase family 2 [Loktanella fryxellensis]
MARLSICIPSYNRTTYLCELLDSILAQAPGDVEVVVCDDASPDDPSAAMEPYRQRFAHFTYIRQPTNLGLFENFLSAVEHASGDFIWLMGDDDRLEPGGLDRVRAALETSPGITGMTVGVVDYDSDMRAPVGLRDMPPSQDLQTAEEVFTLIPEHLGFMSALVINRQQWLTVVSRYPAASFQNYYPQVHIIGLTLKHFGGWKIIHTPCVRYRSDNDQFGTSLGWVKRLKVDVESYDEVARNVFPDSPTTRRAIAAATLRTHVISRIVNLKTGSTEAVSVLPVATYLLRYYWSHVKFWTVALPLLLLPRPAVGWLKTLYRTFMPSSGARRVTRLKDGT